MKWNGVASGVTPSANRNTYSIAIPYCIYTQGRGASPLNPGLGNRNSFRVAAADGHSKRGVSRILHSGWYAPWQLHYLSAAHIATLVTFDSACFGNGNSACMISSIALSFLLFFSLSKSNFFAIITSSLSCTYRYASCCY